MQLFLIITDLGDAGKAPRGRHVCSIHHAGQARGVLQTCCHKYAALTRLGRPSPKSVIIRIVFSIGQSDPAPQTPNLF
ncbi:Uncharacterized protein dnm_074070 [Desulfonema magnum]|uniref:Uncharacterized protein n=1 Tax=Desulfonema magnum TaxID=45655 RepID=A0A975BU38_9BACT|nr:Uncharacterized protein dnm_074070 [Desulfonema magnum]